MWWTKLHLKKPLSSMIFYIILLAMGVWSLGSQSFTVSPEATPPVISVKTQYFGMSAKYIENNITEPIESTISSIRGIESISSVSEDGQSIVTIKLNQKAPLKAITLEIKSAVDTVREKFPGDVQEPVISHYDPSQMPVMIVSYYSKTLDLQEVRRRVEQKMKPVLQKIDGIVECVVTGGKQNEIGVFVDQGRLYASSMQFSFINDAIQGNNDEQYLGKINRDGHETAVYSKGKFQNQMEIGKINVFQDISNKSQGKPLSDVATVENYHKRIDTISRINGQERVSLYLQKRSDGNILKICSDLKLQLKKSPIDEVTYDIDFDKSEEIKESLDNLILSIVIGLVLLFVIMLLYIGDYKQSLVAAIPLPVSLAVSFIITALFHIELNGILMSGIALGVGLLVNDGIIVVAFLGKKKKGISQDRNILTTVKGLIAPLTASLFTTVCVFMPVLFTSQDISIIYSGFVIIITLLLTISLLLSIGFLPVAYRFVENKWPAGSRKKRSPVERLLLELEYFYLKYTKKLFRYRTFVLGTVLMFTMVCGLAVFFKGKNLSSSDSIREIYAYLEPATGTSIPATDELTKQAEAILLKQPEIKKLISKVEKAHSSLIIKLKKEIKDKKAENLVLQYKKALAEVPCFIYLTYGDSESDSKEVSVMFVGNDLDTLKDLCRQASRRIYSLPGLQEVILRFKDDAPQYTLIPNLSKIQLSGLSIKEIVHEARAFLYGVISSKLNPDNQGLTDIRITSLLNQSDKATVQDVLAILVRSKSGEMVPLGELLTVQQEITTSKIYHYNKRRSFSITARLKTGESLSSGIVRISAELNQLKLPEGYFWQFDEKFENLKEMSKVLLLAVLTAIYLTFVTLVITYENFRKAFLTLFVIPFAFIGVFFALYFFDISLSTPVYIAIILLAGITVHNSVLILSGTEKAVTQNQIFHHAKNKLNAIIVTTLTSVAGLVPLLFAGGNGQYLWRPFSITLIFGLISSTLLCLILLPLMVRPGKNE